jgi:hypothetical protein
MKSYRIEYWYNYLEMGFMNSITVKAMNVDKAIEEAKIEVEKCYGSGMMKRFSFKPDPIYCGVVTR